MSHTFRSPAGALHVRCGKCVVITLPMSGKRREIPRGAVIAQRYEVVAGIGQGAMSTVYYAHDRATDQAVALKILHASRSTNEQVVMRFEREATAARSVSHPCVVGYLDSGRADGVPYGVMELTDGETLADRISIHGPMQPKLAAMLIREVALGLGAIHQAGIVHRDIKPSNLMVVFDDDEQPVSMKITDFGLVKILHSSITRADAVMGTATYMAPEQVLNEKVDERTDVYSLGLVLFHALTRVVPFMGRSTTESMAHQLLSKAPPPSWFVEGLSEAFDAVVGMALRKRPAERYASMAELAQDLDRLRLGQTSQLIAAVSHRGPDSYRPCTTRGQQVFAAMRRELH